MIYSSLIHRGLLLPSLSPIGYVKKKELDMGRGTELFEFLNADPIPSAIHRRGAKPKRMRSEVSQIPDRPEQLALNL